MSTERNQLESKASKPVSVTSFSGGKDRGRCLQLTQSRINADITMYVQLDQEQVEQFMADAEDWLAGK